LTPASFPGNPTIHFERQGRLLLDFNLSAAFNGATTAGPYAQTYEETPPRRRDEETIWVREANQDQQVQLQAPLAVAAPGPGALPLVQEHARQKYEWSAWVRRGEIGSDHLGSRREIEGFDQILAAPSSILLRRRV